MAAQKFTKQVMAVYVRSLNTYFPWQCFLYEYFDPLLLLMNVSSGLIWGRGSSRWIPTNTTFTFLNYKFLRGTMYSWKCEL